MKHLFTKSQDYVSESRHIESTLLCKSAIRDFWVVYTCKVKSDSSVVSYSYSTPPILLVGYSYKSMTYNGNVNKEFNTLKILNIGILRNPL